MPSGRLFLVPTLLGGGQPADVLPERTITIARELRHVVAENAKAARGFLKAIGATVPLQSIAIVELNEHTRDGDVPALLTPALAGHDLGLMSDAGCPAVADPGAALVAAAHGQGVAVVPLVGPSSVLLALMASGLNGQGFQFHGYLPAKAEARLAALKRLDAEMRRVGATQVFIETPYRNVAMLQTIVAACAGETSLVVAADVTLATEEIVRARVAEWRGRDFARFQNRPAIFLLGI